MSNYSPLAILPANLQGRASGFDITKGAIFWPLWWRAVPRQNHKWEQPLRSRAPFFARATGHIRVGPRPGARPVA